MKSIPTICIAAIALSFVSTPASSPAGDTAAGAVYTMNNSADGNDILVFHRGSDGALTPAGSVATGGLGTGGGLGNQSGLTLSNGGKWLLAVNAGSDEISVLATSPGGLVVVDRVWSGGSRPVSITTHGDLVYVLNAGGAENGGDNITGFVLDGSGTLWPIADSTRPLSAATTAPAQVGFNPDGSTLIVTEKATGVIDTYTVGIDGLVVDHLVYASVGVTPFGFSFGHRDQLFVSEAFGGMPDASAVSSYQLEPDGELSVISPSAPTTETAACWVVVTNHGKYGYTTNAGSNTVSGYAIGNDGSLQLLQEDGVSGSTGGAPIDMALSRNSRFLYVLNATGVSISGFAVDSRGRLASVGETQLPSLSNGLVAR